MCEGPTDDSFRHYRPLRIIYKFLIGFSSFPCSSLTVIAIHRVYNLVMTYYFIDPTLQIEVDTHLTENQKVPVCLYDFLDIFCVDIAISRLIVTPQFLTLG
jgi:hypothetical protein